MLAVLYGAAFIAAFNENIVNVALVDIMSEYGVSSPTAQWLVTGYMIVTAVVVTLTAFLFQRFGVRKVFFAGIAFLLVGLVVDLFANSFPLLLAGRLVQAVGTGLFIPLMMSTVLAVLPLHKLGGALALGGCMITFGPAFGPVVSGLMVTYFGWHMAFLPSAVLILLFGLAGIVLVRDFQEVRAQKLDFLSVLLVAVGLVVFIYGLSVVMSSAGLAAIMIVVGLLVLGLFVFRQLRIRQPLLDMRPILSARFWPSCILVIVAMITTFSLSVLLPLYFQGSFGMSALVAGALLLVPILMNAVTALIGGRVMDKQGAWPLIAIGFAVIVVGQCGIWWQGPELSWVGVLIAAVVVYAGVGLVFSPAQTTGLSQLTGELHPHGVGIINAFIQVAASIGPSLLIGIMSSGTESALASGGANGDESSVTDEAANALGFADSILVAAIIAVAGLLVAAVYTYYLRKHPVVEGEAQVQAPSVAAFMAKDVYSIPETATVGETIEIMVSKKTSGMPVVDKEGRVIGFISDGDVLRALSMFQQGVYNLTPGLAYFRGDQHFLARIREVLDLNVMELALREVVTADIDTSIEEVCDILGGKRIKKLPVVQDGKLVGSISRSDLVRELLGTFLQPQEPGEARGH